MTHGRFLFFTGSYTGQDVFPGSAGEGIQLWELDYGDGSIHIRTTFSGIPNPSWVAVHPGGRLLAAASEQLGGASRTCLLRIEADGTLVPSGSVPSGDATCHADFSPDGEYLASAAYLAGEVQLNRTGHGILNGSGQVFSYEGSGPDTERQEGPHAHQAVFSRDGRFLYVTDLGSDRIWCHRLDNGCLAGPVCGLSLPPGEGPRHMAFLPDHSRALVVGELTGTVHLLSRNAESGVLSHLDSRPSLPENWDGAPSSAAVHRHPALPLFYVSNRNGGLVTAFRVEPAGDRLESLGHWKVPDPSPRDFQISPDGRWLIVCGQETHRLYVHSLEAESGKVGPCQAEAPCGSPVCIAWWSPAHHRKPASGLKGRSGES